MNQNLMNPEIVSRLAQERELDLRREAHSLPEAESGVGKTAAQNAYTRKRGSRTFAAWLSAAIIR